MKVLARGPGRFRAADHRRTTDHRLRRLSDAVRDADRLRDAVFRAAPDAIVISDAEGRVREVNAAAEALFCRAGDTLVGRWMSDLVELPASAPRADRGNMLSALGQRVQLEGIRPDGGRFPAEITTQHVGRGRRTRFATFIRDLSEERRTAAAAEAQRRHLAEVEKLSAMGSLLSGVAHELNNPLAIVAAQAMLLRERAGDEDVARRADRIHAAAQRAGRTVRSFTALATRRPAQREPLALAEVFAEAQELVGYRLRQGSIVVRATFPPDLPRAAGDHDLLVQVFVNLLLNAQEALLGRDRDRQIEVDAHAGPDGIVTKVEDNGPGVADAVADRLFEPYVSTKAAGTGLGIGLSLCRSVLDQHGGTIDHHPGGSGAAFRVVLPRAEAPPRPGGSAPLSSNLRVLVVDDEIEVARALAELIEVLGHSAVVVTSADEALTRLSTTAFDAVFTDYRMPGMDGTALRTQIAVDHPDLSRRTVLVTGDVRQHAEVGPEGTLVLDKPFTAAAVRSLLSRLAAPAP